MSLVASFVDIVQPLSWAMSTPVFNRFLIVLTGWIFSPRRTITGALIAAGVAGQQHHAAFHRVFSAARWSLDQLGLIVFELLKVLLPEGTVGLSLDDTEAHKRGKKVYGVGMHHDPQLVTARNRCRQAARDRCRRAGWASQRRDRSRPLSARGTARDLCR